ncbi:DUF4344 domain-containing metallopeptidase [Novilysobacter defluvii]|uniref:Metallopeptidase n=1 Tax=Lysobacter defluvii IMMIB APB-9 = DSM 18482 TaxID=1385515 RepID=A0A0A0M7S4_9GAMM|nr:DUF4344 domain-containing metallopeptidase [Lysobacter defluvii]KGO99018.1 hypothetical protein N791_07070 [Lysobacter defluvii IMMIB APB-9 = DSM 18482]
MGIRPRTTRFGPAAGWRVAGLFLLAPLVAAGAPSIAADSGPGVGAGGFRYAYLEPRSDALLEVHERVESLDLLRRIPELRWLDGVLALPQPLTFLAAECGQADAFYDPGRAHVVLCYEMLHVLYAQGAERARVLGISGVDAVEEAEDYVWANLRFIASHETGHALIDLLDLPVTGRQEDAVDQFATTLMQYIGEEGESRRQAAESLRMAAHWFLTRAGEEVQGLSLDTYADTHSLGLQRYFNLQCLLYGSDPERFASIVADGDLPESRAVYCPREARRAQEAWVRLLMPHFSPARPELRGEAERWLQQRRHRPAP